MLRSCPHASGGKLESVSWLSRGRLPKKTTKKKRELYALARPPTRPAHYPLAWINHQTNQPIRGFAPVAARVPRRAMANNAHAPAAPGAGTLMGVPPGRLTIAFRGGPLGAYKY